MFGKTGMTRKTRMTGMARITRVNKITGVNGITIACEHSCLSSLLAARDVSQERCLLLNERNSKVTM